MTTTVGELCSCDVVVATPETTATDAAKLMRHHHVGCVVIVEQGNGGLRTAVGIVTDRDIVVEITAPGLDPATIKVGDIMRRELVTVRADKAVVEAVQIMRSKGIRRLPVVTGDGKLVGIVALDDLLAELTGPLIELSKVFVREQSREAAQRR